MSPPPALRLPPVLVEAASGETAEIYEAIRGHLDLGFVPDVFQLLGSRPRFLRNLFETYRSVFDEGYLDRGVKELIAAFVARDAGCHYCAQAHSVLAQMIGAPPELVAATQAARPADMPVTDNLRALMELVVKLDHSAYRILDDDMDSLRSLGWTNAELLEAVWTACVFNAVVRLVDAFGLVELGQLGFDRAASHASATQADS